MRKYVLILMLMLGACRTEPQPTPSPEVTGTIPAPLTTLPPETAVSTVPSATDTPPPTPTPMSPQTPTPTTLPTVTVSSAEEVVTIDQLAAAAVAGQPFTFSGRVVPVISTTLTLQLQVSHQIVFTSGLPFDAGNGTWSVTPELPPVAGPAELLVSGANTGASVAFVIEPPLDQPGPYVILSRPASGQMAAPGYMLYFSGEAQDLIDSQLTMAVLAEGCTTTVAAFSFALTGGIWNGELVLPQTAPPGPACAVAYTGERGAENWREMRVPLTILAAGDERARYIRLGNPPQLTFTAGETAVVYGVAANAPEGEVQVSLVQGIDAESGSVLDAGPAVVDTFGQWEVTLFVPEDQTGPALLLVAMGSGETYTELRLETAVTP